MYVTPALPEPMTFTPAPLSIRYFSILEGLEIDSGRNDLRAKRLISAWSTSSDP
jgi:hypothetical protein